MRTDKKILITGAAGFVGANLTRALLDRFTKLHIIIKPSSNLWRIKDILKHLSIHEADLVDAGKVKKLVGRIKPCVIFHLASHGSYPFQNDFGQVINSTILSTVNLLEGLKNVDFECFINTGSSSEYGFKSAPMKESDVLEPTFFYAAAKASNSLICKSYAKILQKRVITLRLFSVYGPWEEPTRLIPIVIKSALGKQPVFMTSGKQTRDFVYVDDVVEACIQAYSKTGVSGEIFNIGTGKQTSVQMIIEKILNFIGNDIKIHRNKYPQRMWDTDYWVADTTKARKHLGWKPRHNLDSGLEKTIKWFKEHIELYR